MTEFQKRFRRQLLRSREHAEWQRILVWWDSLPPRAVRSRCGRAA